MIVFGNVFYNFEILKKIKNIDYVLIILIESKIMYFFIVLLE